MSRVLQGVTLPPYRLTLVGALAGVLDFFGRGLPQPYLTGTTGHAFRLTLDLVLSPGAPHEINFHELFGLWENLGVWCRRVAARRSDEGFSAVRDEALTRLAAAVTSGRPAIAFDLLGLPEYGLVVGAEEGQLACLTLGNTSEPKWMATADWPPASHGSFTRAEAITLLDLTPDFDRHRAEKASLRFAVAHYWAPPSRDMWLHHGKGAYQFWGAILRSSQPLHGGADPSLGHSHNLAVLHRARRDAAVYLEEIADRYPEALLGGGG